jgi:dTDP-4-dehydrorhamnose reductase
MRNSSLTRIVVTGGAGQLAQCLKPYFPFAEYPTKKELNVADQGSCKAYFSTRSVELILHLAAETAFDAPAESYLMNNVVGTTNIALWAKRIGARLVYTSTDYVYPGTDGPYDELAPIAPIGAYATSKYAGECAVALHPNALTIRGSWYSRLDWPSAALDAFSSRQPVELAAGQVAALACSLATGVVNVGGPRRSIYEIVATEFNPRVVPCQRKDLRLPYEVPADVSLNCERARALLA